MRCGLLGRNAGAQLFSARSTRMLGDYSYELFEKHAGGAGKLPAARRRFDGLNVTIPYKKAVLPYCAALSDGGQREIGSANTLVRPPGRHALRRQHRRVRLFAASLARMRRESVRAEKALVFGSGGASRHGAVRAAGARRARGASVISRCGRDTTTKTSSDTRTHEILVNTTPLGMYPNNGASPADLDALSALRGTCWTWCITPRARRCCCEADGARHPARGRASDARGAGKTRKRSCLPGSAIADTAHR